MKELLKQHRKEIRSRDTIIKRQLRELKSIRELYGFEVENNIKLRKILSSTVYKEIDYLYKLVKEYAPSNEEEIYWEKFRS